jgi:hypothetical protein
VKPALTRSGPVDKVAEVEALRRVDDLFGKIDQLDKVARSTGTEWGRAGQFRRQLAAEDYSLARMMMQAQVAKGEKPLTPEEKVQITELQQRITELQKKLGERTPGGKDDGTEDRVDLTQAKRKWNRLTTDFKEANLSVPQKIFRGVTGLFDATRAIMTAFDFSAVFRQGGILTFAHPFKAIQAFPDMIKSFGSQRVADRAMDAINQRPNADLYKKAGLFLSDPDAGLRGQEEAFMGRLVKKIPGLAGSERAYNTFLNRMRADVFDSMASSLGKGGRVGEAEAQVIANFVNVSTGRSGLGSLENAAVPLARLFFSPRFLASRLQTLALQPFYSGTAATRVSIAKEYGRALLGLGAFYALMSLDDKAKFTWDSRSADFGKVVVGNTHIDPLAGLAQLTVFGTRLTTGETKSTTSDKVTPLRGDKVKYGGQTTSDVITRFVRSKLAPLPGAAWNLAEGRNVVGEKVTPASQAQELVTPLALNDVYKSMEDQGAPKGLITSLLAILGMGTQTYEPKKKK